MSSWAVAGSRCELFNHLNFPQVELWAHLQPFGAVSSCSCSVFVFDYTRVFRTRLQTHFSLVLIMSNDERTHTYQKTTEDLPCSFFSVRRWARLTPVAAVHGRRRSDGCIFFGGGCFVGQQLVVICFVIISGGKNTRVEKTDGNFLSNYKPRMKGSHNMTV